MPPCITSFTNGVYGAIRNSAAETAASTLRPTISGPPGMNTTGTVNGLKTIPEPMFFTYPFPIPDASGTTYYCDTQVPQSAADAQVVAPSWLYLQ